MKFKFVRILALLLLINCKPQQTSTVTINGYAQGTTYHVIYFSKNHSISKQAIDSIFRQIDQSLSTYLSSSIISRINNNDSSVRPDDHFIQVFLKAVEVSKKTNGVFDVTVAPLVNAWGFGSDKKAKNPNSTIIDSLLDFVGYNKVRVEGKQIIKEKPEIKLDFNAIAPGYTVDVLATFLESKGIQNYLIELGGEVKAKGKKDKNENWTVGIDQPNEISEEGRPLKAIVKLIDKALATSGNYRNFYVENGNKYAHIIDPSTGYPGKNNLLSATVIARDCITADAYATAFMIMGLEKTQKFIMQNPDLNLSVFLIYDEAGSWRTFRSEVLKDVIEEVP